MRHLIFITILVSAISVKAQSKEENRVRDLSTRIFQWEIGNHIDSLEDVLAENLRVVNSRGEIETKSQYTAVLRSGSISHDSIDIESSEVTITDNTAVVIGKGVFNMTVSGNKVRRHLSFMEVFTQHDGRWKLFSLHATAILD